MPCDPPEIGARARTAAHIYLTPDLDAGLWAAELAVGETPGRAYVVGATGHIEDVRELTGWKAPNHPFISFRSREPLGVTREVTAWIVYHGTRADLVFRLNEAPIGTDLEGEFNCFALMDTASCFILSSALAPVDEARTIENVGQASLSAGEGV